MAFIPPLSSSCGPSRASSLPSETRWHTASSRPPASQVFGRVCWVSVREGCPWWFCTLAPCYTPRPEYWGRARREGICRTEVLFCSLVNQSGGRPAWQESRGSLQAFATQFPRGFTCIAPFLRQSKKWGGGFSCWLVSEDNRGSQGEAGI